MKKLFPILIALLTLALPSAASANIIGDLSAVGTYASIGKAMAHKANRTVVEKQYDEGVLSLTTTNKFNLRKKFVYSVIVDANSSYGNSTTLSTARGEWGQSKYRGRKCWTKHKSTYGKEISNEFTKFSSENSSLDLTLTITDADTMSISGDVLMLGSSVHVGGEINYDPGTFLITSTPITSTVTSEDGTVAHASVNTTYVYSAPRRPPSVKRLCR